MSSNGIWIANATGDTMMNGSGINPGGVTSSWPNGLPMMANNIYLPYPADSNKYIFLHHTATFNGIYSPTYELFSTLIDLTLDNGLGGITQKNNIVFQDTLNWGVSACRHANGRDWWVVMMKDSSDLVFKILITPAGISSVSSQQLNYLPLPWGNPAQLTFSQNGNQLITTTYFPESSLPMDSANSSLVIFDFDRCNGLFSNSRVLKLSDSSYLWGLAFSPSGKFAYSCSDNYIFQINIDDLSVDTVAVYDGFISPVGFSCCQTSFFNMYLAANGKIYVTSGSGVQHLHEINYPDSAGIACDVQQHAINLGYAQLRAVPNHPNYYLGCDSTSSCTCLTTGINDVTSHDFNFSVSPNPNNGNFKIMYFLPQNKKGRLEIFDVNRRLIYELQLPQWSTMQEVSLPSWISSGVYNCVITSGDKRVNRKIAVIKE
jgi:hypothetical protein